MAELLAPVGNIDMLQAAIDAGADAVYLSGPRYGARADKANFTIEQLQQAIRLAHLYDVAVYITVNTLIKEDELADCFDYLDQLAVMAVDAIIVQDLAVVRYLTHYYPALEVHGSTQMAIYDLKGVQQAARLGLSRVVIARETPLATIADIIQHSPIEIEVFIHGALCYAYSGQCLLSGVIGGRSGNRGQCAQPCRLKYDSTFNKKSQHIMSMCDLTSIDQFKQLQALRISAFKIEGRLRSADYVYHTVNAYYLARSGADERTIANQTNKMYRAFNRSYTGGFLWSDSTRLSLDAASNLGEYIGQTAKSNDRYKLKLVLTTDLQVGDAIKIVTPKGSKGVEIFNIYQDSVQLKSATAGSTVAVDYNGRIAANCAVYRTRSKQLHDQRTTDSARRSIALTMHFTIDSDYRARLTVNDGKQTVTVDAKSVAQPAKSHPLDYASVIRYLQKLGDTPYTLDDLTCQLAVDAYMSASQLNDLRRRAIDKISGLRMQRPVYAKRQVQALIPPDYAANAVPIICYIATLEQYHALKSYNWLLFSANHKLCQYENVLPALPPFSHSQDTEHSPALLISNIAHLASDTLCYLDFHGNVYNSWAYDQWCQMGVDDITISVELAQHEIEQLIKVRPIRAFAYGKLPVMYSRSCAKLQDGQECASCPKCFTVNNEQVGHLNVTCQAGMLCYHTGLPLVRDWLWTSPKRQPLYIYFSDEDSAQTARVADAIDRRFTLDIARLSAFKQPIK